MKSKAIHSLIVCLILTAGHLTSVTAVTDAELEVLEKQIEQLEAEEKQRADTEAKADEAVRMKKQAESKARADAEAKRKAEEVEQVKLEKQKQEAEAKAKEKAEEEEKSKYNALIAEAEKAFNDKDKTQAIQKYNEALALFPGDVVATRGLVDAEGLKHKLCYEVLGKWIWDKAFGKDYIILYDGGSLDYQTSIKGSGNWECTSPETRTIKLRVSAAGFSNEWLSTYSADGSCLLGPETWGDRGCYHRPEAGKKSEKNVPAKDSSSNIP